jgi:secondary thiamine-phosphate synthase enzyme
VYSQERFSVATRGRGTHEISEQVARIVAQSGVRTGLCHVFVHHTSASLMLCENADPQVRRDLEAFMARLAPDGDPLFRHDTEGPDDMTGLTLPVADGRCALGTWQGIYLWEHRTSPHRREITVTVHGNT